MASVCCCCLLGRNKPIVIIKMSLEIEMTAEIVSLTEKELDHLSLGITHAFGAQIYSRENSRNGGRA